MVMNSTDAKAWKIFLKIILLIGVLAAISIVIMTLLVGWTLMSTSLETKRIERETKEMKATIERTINEMKNENQRLEEENLQKKLELFQLAIERPFFAEQKRYPRSLSELTEKYPSIMSDFGSLISTTQIEYSLEPDGKTYRMCSITESKKRVCLQGPEKN